MRARPDHLWLPKIRFSQITATYRGAARAVEWLGWVTAWAKRSPPTPLGGGDGVSTLPASSAALVALVVAMVSVLCSRAPLHFDVLPLRH